MAVERDDPRLARDELGLAAAGTADRLHRRDDARLVEALRADRPGAFAELVTDYQNAVFSLALRLVRDREDARDVTQDVFLKAYRRIPHMQGELHLWAWLYRVTVNTCWDHLRAASRRPLPSDEAEMLAETGFGDDGERAELSRLFSQSLAALSPRQQAALLLKDVHGLNHSDIADTLGITRASSEILLFRARHSFRRAYTALVAEEPAAAVCRVAEHAAAASVGGRLSAAQRRRITAHARTCPACRKVVDGWRGPQAVGLALALPMVAAPHLFGAHAGASAAAGAGLAGAGASVGAGASAAAGVSAGAASAGVGAASASVAAPLAAGGVSTGTALGAAGGLAAKVAGLGLAKVAVLAVAAASVATVGGVEAYRSDAAHRPPPRTPVASAVVVTHGALPAPHLTAEAPELVVAGAAGTGVAGTVAVAQEPSASKRQLPKWLCKQLKAAGAAVTAAADRRYRGGRGVGVAEWVRGQVGEGAASRAPGLRHRSSARQRAVAHALKGHSEPRPDKGAKGRSRAGVGAGLVAAASKPVRGATGAAGVQPGTRPVKPAGTANTTKRTTATVHLGVKPLRPAHLGVNPLRPAHPRVKPAGPAATGKPATPGEPPKPKEPDDSVEPEGSAGT